MGVSRLAAFAFIIQVSAVLVNAMNVFPAYNMTVSTSYADEPLRYNSTNMSYITAGMDVSQATTYGWGDYLWAMIRWISLIFGYIAWYYNALSTLGFHTMVAGAVQLIIWYAYGEALIGFVRGHNVGGY